jgi:hypothetical protein
LAGTGVGIRSATGKGAAGPVAGAPTGGAPPGEAAVGPVPDKAERSE